jgi:hypothetical protein
LIDIIRQSLDLREDQRFGVATAPRSGMAMTTSATFLGVIAKATVGHDRRTKHESCSSFRPREPPIASSNSPFLSHSPSDGL